MAKLVVKHGCMDSDEIVENMENALEYVNNKVGKSCVIFEGKRKTIWISSKFDVSPLI